MQFADGVEDPDVPLPQQRQEEHEADGRTGGDGDQGSAPDVAGPGQRAGRSIDRVGELGGLRQHANGAGLQFGLARPPLLWIEQPFRPVGDGPRLLLQPGQQREENGELLLVSRPARHQPHAAMQFFDRGVDRRCLLAHQVVQHPRLDVVAGLPLQGDLQPGNRLDQLRLAGSRGEFGIELVDRLAIRPQPQQAACRQDHEHGQHHGHAQQHFAANGPGKQHGHLPVVCEGSARFATGVVKPKNRRNPMAGKSLTPALWGGKISRRRGSGFGVRGSGGGWRVAGGGWRVARNVGLRRDIGWRSITVASIVVGGRARGKNAAGLRPLALRGLTMGEASNAKKPPRS